METDTMQMTGAQPLTNELYQAYSPDTTTVQARAAFARKYGYEPDRVFWFNRLVWAGPVKGETK